MADHSAIEHEGTVISVDTSRHEARVRIDRGSAGCDGCAAAFMCGAGKGEELVASCPGELPAVGGRVRLVASTRTQRLAVLLLLALPCVVLVAVTVGCVTLAGMDQGVGAATGLAATALVFTLVYLLIPGSMRRLSFRVKGGCRRD